MIRPTWRYYYTGTGTSWSLAGSTAKQSLGTPMTLEEIKMLGFCFALGRRVANMRALARDAEFVQPKNSQWVTFENKQRVLIDKSSGEILLGLGDQNGKMIDELSEGKKAVRGDKVVDNTLLAYSQEEMADRANRAKAAIYGILDSSPGNKVSAQDLTKIQKAFTEHFRGKYPLKIGNKNYLATVSTKTFKESLYKNQQYAEISGGFLDKKDIKDKVEALFLLHMVFSSARTKIKRGWSEPSGLHPNEEFMTLSLAVGGKELVVDIKRRRGGCKNWMNTHYAHFAKDEEMRAEEVELVCVRWK